VSSDFKRLLEEAQAGREGAAQQLYDEYGPYILRAVRRRLQARLRRRFDSIDFTQDVWASFFGHVASEYELDSPAQLVGLLTTMARNKVADMGRRRGPAQPETSLEQDLNRGAGIASTQATPSQIVMAEEEWRKLLAEQRPVHRRILLLLREGQADATIAENLGLSLKTVQRVARKLLP
jgi:DNA-directed RNA polymerase specialized sigma24 family protein